MKKPPMPMGIKLNDAPPTDAASPKGNKFTDDTKATPALMRKSKMRGKPFGGKPMGGMPKR